MAKAKAPTSVEIRAFQVGFGDCLLVSFIYSAKDKRHVLIDFGTTELPGRGKPVKAAKASDHMPVIATEIAITAWDRPPLIPHWKVG